MSLPSEISDLAKQLQAKVRHEWEVSGSVSSLMENGKPVGGCCMSSHFNGFYWSIEPGVQGYCDTLDAAKAACIAKRLEILEKGK